MSALIINTTITNAIVQGYINYNYNCDSNCSFGVVHVPILIIDQTWAVTITSIIVTLTVLILWDKIIGEYKNVG